MKPVPYALDDGAETERFLTSTGSQFRGTQEVRVASFKPKALANRPLPYALDEGAEKQRFVTSSSEAFIARNLREGRPAKLASSNWHSRPLPYARDDGVDEPPALAFKKKENRFTSGRPQPYALDDPVAGSKADDMYSTASGEEYIARDLKEARPAKPVTREQVYDIVTLVDKPAWSNLEMRWAKNG
ncbi:hypothetical protein T492DRAFT_1082888 [Pavlovales sp. CCMP2436]|nr:hypothetical protein T492DRAFT_1082888 [Pavlovales sp. CCMP2436]